MLVIICEAMVSELGVRGGVWGKRPNRFTVWGSQALVVDIFLRFNFIVRIFVHFLQSACSPLSSYIIGTVSQYI